jgi:putative sigma-54 modulation protein
MKVAYTGIQKELPSKIQSKLEAKFAKLSKLLDGRGEHKAHVVVSQEKRGQRAEVTVQFYDHQFVGIGSDPDLFTALAAALAKLETQAVKHKAKWRETHRRKDAPKRVASAGPNAAAEKAPGQKVIRVNGMSRLKPVTLDEALLEMDQGRDYFAYRDAETDRLSVLVRRRDGNFDLIES